MFIKSLFASLFCFALYFNSIGQKNKIELLPGSEIAEYDQISGIHKLYRNVRFLNQKNTIYCDSAIFNERTNRIRSFGNVQIQKNRINIYCDSLDYQTKNKYAKLWGNVRARDLEYKISSDSMDYDLSSGRAIFRNKGNIESIKTNETIQSTYGYFYPKSKNFFFSDEVYYQKNELSINTDTLQFNYKDQSVFFHGFTTITKDSTIINCNNGYFNIEKNEGKIVDKATIKKGNIYVDADTIFYLSNGKDLLSVGNSFYKDDSLKLKVFADRIFTSDSSDNSYCTGKSIIEKEFNSDTLFFCADSVVICKDSTKSLSIIEGHRDLKVFHKDFTIIGDTGKYFQKNKSIYITQNPIMWSDKIEFKGNRFRLYLNDSTLDSAFISKNCSIIAELDSGMYFNQLYGQNMSNYFIDKKLKKSIIEGNAESYFFPFDEKKNDSIVTKKRYGLNKLLSSKLIISFDNREINQISYIQNPDGIFIPMSKLTENDVRSDGFKTNFEKKPNLSLPLKFSTIP